MHDRGQQLRVARRVLHDARVRVDRVLGNRECEVVAVAVEDAPALGGQGHRVHPLRHGHRFVVAALDTLHVDQADQDDPERQRHDHEQRDQALVGRDRGEDALRRRRGAGRGLAGLRLAGGRLADRRFANRRGTHLRRTRRGLDARPLRRGLPRGRTLGDGLLGPGRLRLRARRGRAGAQCASPRLGADPLRCGCLRRRGLGASGATEARRTRTAARSGGGGSGCGSRPSGRVPAPTRLRRGRPLRPGTASRITAVRQGASSPSPSPGRGWAPSLPHRRSRNRRPSGPARSRSAGSSPGSCRGGWRA